MCSHRVPNSEETLGLWDSGTLGLGQCNFAAHPACNTDRVHGLVIVNGQLVGTESSKCRRGSPPLLLPHGRTMEWSLAARPTNGMRLFFVKSCDCNVEDS